jgi:hypothetical protein
METNLTSLYPLVASNSIWALGEMVITLDSSILRPIGVILINHILILLKTTLHPPPSFSTAVTNWGDGTLNTLKQNLAITLGRIAMMCPNEAVDEVHSMLLATESLEGWFRSVYFSILH